MKKDSKSVQKQAHFKTKKLTFGQKAADKVSELAGSWAFISLFLVFIFIWATLNTLAVFFGVWDPYPFILLNLFLSCLAAIQAPVILMSQNRQSETDRQRAQYDYLVNRKAEREIKQLQIDVLEIKQVVLKQSTRGQLDYLREEMKKLESELDKINNKK